MNGWARVHLGDIVELQSGGTPAKSNPEFWNGDLPWVSPKDVKVLRLYETEDNVTEAAVGNGTRAVEAGTILLVVRSMILSREVPLAVTRKRMTFNQDIKAIHPRPDVDAGFLLSWLLANRPAILGIVDEAGHGTKRIQTDRLLALPVNLPPLGVQRRIASILGAYDDLVDVNQRRIALLEEMARRAFEEWFVHFRFPGAETQISSAGIPQRPKSWKVGVASDLVHFDPPTRLPRTGQKPFIPMANLDTRYSAIHVSEERESGSGAKFQNDDTLFARITPCLENGKTGLVRDLPGDGVGFGSTEFIVMRGHIAGPSFTYLLARHNPFRAHAQRSMSGASGRQRARTESVKLFEIALPPRKLLDQFEAIVWPMLELVGRLSVANKHLAASRDLLLPRLISGELSVIAAERGLEAAA